MYAILTALVLAQPAPVPAPVPAPPQVPPMVEMFPSYRSTNGPVVVFVACKPRKVDGVKACVERTFPDVSGAAIVVSPDGVKRIDLQANASDSEIRQAAGLEVSRAARPFLRRPGERRTADDDIRGYGSWPVTIAKIEGLERYAPAKYTQSIVTRNNAPAIDAVHRSALSMEWQVPGGMEGVSGWSSDLYRYVPEGWQRQWTARLPVLNSFGNFQYELGWTRAYPDGTVFMDVLSNAETGKVFEARIAEKNNGAWDRYVAYRDAGQYPAGYEGLKRSCASCHEGGHAKAPGTGGYGTALISGSDGIYSDPFPALER